MQGYQYEATDKGNTLSSASISLRGAATAVREQTARLRTAPALSSPYEGRWGALRTFLISGGTQWRVSGGSHEVSASQQCDKTKEHLTVAASQSARAALCLVASDSWSRTFVSGLANVAKSFNRAAHTGIAQVIRARFFAHH